MTDSQLTQVLNLQIMGTEKMVAAIKKVERSQREYSRALLKTKKSQDSTRSSAKKLSDQGLANIQAGLVQLSTYLLNMNVKINNVFDSMQKGFAKTETAMNLLKSTMGLAGETDISALGDFTRAEDKISKLAMTTEYTKAEIAGAFQSMKQDGLSLDDTLGVIGDTLQFATASGGMLSLEEAAKITTLTFKTLGGDTKDMGRNLNSLYKITTDTSLGFDGIREALSGLRVGAQSFAKSDLREATINTFIAALMEGGESAANAGLKYKNFGGSVLKMFSNLTSLDRKLQETGKLSKRANLKNLAIQRLTGASDLDIKTINQALGKQYESVAQALKMNYVGVMQVRNRYAVSQLFTRDKDTGKLALKSAEDFGTDLLNRYRKIANEKGVVEAQSTLSDAFGTEAGSQTIKALDLFLKKRGVTLKEYAEGVNRDLGELDKAQADALQTLEKRIKLSESAESALSESIFKHDVYARAGLDTYTELVKATNVLMSNNETLASTTSFLGRTMQLATGIGTNMGFMLTAAATFSIALKHAQTNVAGTTKSLGSTMRAFSTMFLAPTLTVVLQLAGGLFVLGVMIVATMKYFSEAETLGEGFRVVLDKIQQSAKALGGMFQLMFTDSMQGKSIKEFIKQNNRLREEFEIQLATQKSLEHQYGANDRRTIAAANSVNKLAGQLNELNSVLTVSGREGLEDLSDKYNMRGVAYSMASGLDMLRDLVAGFARIAEGMLVPAMASLGMIFTMLKGALNVFLVPFKVLAMLFTSASDEVSLMSNALRILGFFLGVVISAVMVFKTFTFFLNMISLMGNKFKQVRGAVESSAASLGKMNVAMRQNKPATDALTRANERNLTMLERLRLRYDALRGKVTDYNRAVINSKNITQQYADKKAALAGTFDRAHGAAMGLASGLLVIGEGMKSFSDESSWIYGVGEQLSKMGGIILLLTPIIQMLTFAVNTLGLSLGVAFSWVAVIIIGIIALAAGLKAIYNWWSGKDKKEKSSTSTSSIQSIGKPVVSASSPMASSGDASMFATSSTPPTVSKTNVVNGAGGGVTHAKRIDGDWVQSQTNIEKVVIHTNQEAGRVIRDVNRYRGAPSLSTASTAKT